MAGSAVLQGRSGAKYSFQVYDWGTCFKALGGVYAILRLDAPGFCVLYVGQTGDLSARFDDHHKALSFMLHRRTHIGVLLEGSEVRRLAIERDLIAGYQPTCNGD